MINIKTVAATVAAVTVAGVTVQQIITRTRKDAVDNDPTSSVVASSFAAFNKAQDVISDRMLAGFYDDKDDDFARLDFQILYTNFLLEA